MTKMVNLEELLRRLTVDDASLHIKLLSYCMNNGLTITDSYRRDKEFIDYDFFMDYILDKNNFIQDRYSLFRCLTFRAFSDNNYDVEIIKKLYISLLKEFSYKSDICYEDRDFTKKAFIFCDLYTMNDAHAPSAIITRWAEALASRGLEVEILATPSYTYPFPLKKISRYYRLTVSGGVFQVMKNVTLTEIPGMVTDDFYNWLLEKKVSRKDIFILIGNLNFHFDIVKSNNKFVHPTASSFNFSSANSVIFSDNYCSNFFNIYNNPMGFIQAPLDYKIGNNGCLFLSPVVEEKKPINLVVVGNRLNDELTDDFWSSISNIISKNSLIFLYVIGGYEKKVNFEIEKNVYLVGYQNDLCGFFKNMHIYINPPRIGGGTTARLAIRSGLPVITLNYGDAYMAIKQAYYIENFYEDLHEFIKNYVFDVVFKNKIDEINKSVVESLDSDNDIQVTINSVFKNIF
jgi:hypothetical protein